MSKVRDIVELTRTNVVDADIGTAVQAYDATIVVDSDIGSTVQAYDADTTKNDAANTFTATQTIPAIKLTTGAGASKVLTSDANGDASWLAPAAGGATDIDGLTDGYNDGSSVGLGTGALANNDGTTNKSTAVGTGALTSTTDSYGSTAIGHNSLYSTTTGFRNTGVGSGSLYSNTTGNMNVSSGYSSLYLNTTGSDNTASGYRALQKNTTGIRNTAVGRDSLQFNTTASYNTAIGYQAGSRVTTGTRNTTFGYTAGNQITTGSNNTIIGDYDGIGALADTVVIAAGTTERLKIDASGLSINGSTFYLGIDVGYATIPQNSKSAAYTLVAGDSGKHILHPSADTTARIFTIPANSSVAYEIGTAITFVNENAAGTLTIAITTDTMRLAGDGTTGNRTLAANGVATAIKLTATSWIISGGAALT